VREDVPPLSDGADGNLLGRTRRRLAIDGAGIAVSVVGFGLVYGVAARTAGFTPVDVGAMGVFVFAGAAQFAAVGYVAQGLGWPSILLLTAFINARHLLYGAALAPWVADRPRSVRALMAYALTDESFALGLRQFRELGRADLVGYWIAAVAVVWIPWNLSTMAGVLIGGAVPDPTRLGLDLVFPAAMAGMAVGLATGRREVAAAGAGAGIAVAVGLAAGPSAGIVAGGLLGPLAGMAAPGRVRDEEADEAAIEEGEGDRLIGGAP
jgi:4-azaleucine resistance transporter AzlC